jgi:hypothetical protein
MTRTTPPRPDVVAAVPELAAYARTATRLHPRPGSPGVGDSSIGGPLRWPAEEPWPVCAADNTIAHHAVYLRRPADERLRRRILSAAYGRTPRGESLRLTKRERALLDQADRPVPASELDGAVPLPLLAVAQLYRRDVPDLPGPKDADLSQVLWCPFSGHGGAGEWDPTVVLKWRRAAEIDLERVVVQQPEPPLMESDYFLPEPCVLHPEQVVEYPGLDLLPDGLQQRLRQWEWDAGQRYYGYDGVAIAAGWKVGGWTRGLDPWRWRQPLVCACGELLELLLKIEEAEWGYDEDRGDYPWRPVEDADADDDGEFEVYPWQTQPTMITTGRVRALWLFACPTSADHPARTMVEW